MKMTSKILGTMVLTVAWATPSLAASETFNLEHEHFPGELIVTFENDIEKSSKLSLFNKVNAQEVHSFRSSPSSHIKFFEKGDTTWLIEQAKFIANQPGVASVEANTVIRILEEPREEVLPNDPKFERLYGLQNTGSTGGTAGADISAPAAWAITTGSHDVVVGVIDTGVDYNHPDIAPNYWNNPGEMGVDEAGNDKRDNGIDDDANGYVDDWRGWNFVHNNNNPMDDNRHGTHCAGTIGAAGNDGYGVVGVAWDVSMVGIKFLSAGGSGSLVDAVKSIEYGTTLGVNMTSNSWGGGGFSETMFAAIQEAADQGILFVAAAGNSSTNNDVRPAYLATYQVENVISVAASDHNDRLASFSSYGPNTVHLAAPGVNIWSAVPNERFESLSGTSMAAPHVSGAAALIWSAYPDISYQQVKERLINSVDHVPAIEHSVMSAGRLNAYNALQDDDVPPGEVLNIQVLRAGTTALELSWDASGDDGYEGYASRYLVRVSDAPILTEQDWQDSANPRVSMESNLRQPTILAEVANLAFNTSGYLAVRAIDKVGNISELSASMPFSLQPMTVISAHSGDTMEGITSDAPWGIQDTDQGPAFADSPNGQYENNIDVSMTLPEVVVDGEGVLTFHTRYDIENNFDFGHVEISTNGGTSFQSIERFTGASAWGQHTFDLSQYLNGETRVTIRFRVTTDHSIVGSGWLINRVEILGPATL